MKQWEIIADRLRKAGWSLGWVSAVDLEGRTIWIVDAHRERLVVRANEKLSVFVELERQMLTVTFHLDFPRARITERSRSASLIRRTRTGL